MEISLEYLRSAIVVAGMSGHSIQRICEASPEVVGGLKQLIVQPNTAAHLLRAFAHGAEFHLADERMIQERGRYFIVCKFVRRTGVDPAYPGMGMDQAEAFEMGPLLIKRRDPVARDYFRSQTLRLTKLVQGGSTARLADLTRYQRAYRLCCDR